MRQKALSECCYPGLAYGFGIFLNTTCRWALIDFNLPFRGIKLGILDFISSDREVTPFLMSLGFMQYIKYIESKHPLLKI